MRRSFVCLWFTVFLVISWLAIPLRVFAQYDPDCYFPIVGQAGVIDTIYGSHDNQRLTVGYNIGPAPDSVYGRELILGLPQYAPFVPAVSTGPIFNLHKLQVSQTVDSILGAYKYRGYKLVHLRSPRYTDILANLGATGSVGFPIVFWGDESGNYDTSRTTRLHPKPGKELGDGYESRAYCTHLSQDSIDDVIVGAITIFDSSYLDTLRFYHFRGGESLYKKGRIAYEDSSATFLRDSGTHSNRQHIQADFRGTGRDDLLAGDFYGNLFYFKNDPPFTLSNFVHAMLYDTVWTPSENPQVPHNAWVYLPYQFALSAFPKPTGDRSLDFVWGVPTIGDGGHGNFYFFRGGPDFGSHHFTIDSAAFIMYAPAHYGSGIDWGGGPIVCGDMTGSGNPVIAMTNSTEGHVATYFYVLGKALDDKIDMEVDMADDFPWVTSFGVDGWDTIKADNDNRTDVILGMHNYTVGRQQDNGWLDVGTIQVIHGSRKIPVHTNAISQKPLSVNELDLFPNPLRSVGTLILVNSGPAIQAHIVLRDILGRRVFERVCPIGKGRQSIKLNFGERVSGSYRLEVEFGSQRLTKQVEIVK